MKLRNDKAGLVFVVIGQHLRTDGRSGISAAQFYAFDFERPRIVGFHKVSYTVRAPKGIAIAHSNICAKGSTCTSLAH